MGRAESRDPPVEIGITYKSDLFSVAQGGIRRGTRYLDNLDVVADVDLDRVLSLRGTRLHAHLLNNLGGMPNDLAGTLQGINNIEVDSHRARIFQLWVEHVFAGEQVSILAGHYDLNSEFYQNDPAGLLIAPAFGIGSEISATGPNGPSIFPLTALAARIRVTNGDVYGQAAMVNARASTVGHPRGTPFSGKYGILAIGELGWSGSRGKLGLGVWQYSKRQPALLPPDLIGARTTSRARGAYVVLDVGLSGDADAPRYLQAFARGGLADGRTTPFKGGWQAGLLLNHVFAGRPGSKLSIGANSALLSSRFRRLTPVGSPKLSGSEQGFEITYSDNLLPNLSVQPDLQYIRHPGGDSSIRDAVVIGLRLQADFTIGLP